MAKKKKIIGYKMFKVDTDGSWYCDGGGRRFYYEVGKTYEVEDKPQCCDRGFHFCEKLEDCFEYYDCVTWNKIALVEALGDVAKSNNNDKCSTNKIKILKEISFKDIPKIMKTGVSRSYGILNSYGVDNTLFLANKPQTYSIFGKEVSESYYTSVFVEFKEKLNGWAPTFNNLRGLYQKFGCEWKFVPIPEAEEISKEEAWRDMPKEAIGYISSVPEFDAEMFKEITGIEVKNDR